jgi:hypothetical protein
MAALPMALGGPKRPDDGTTPPWPGPAVVMLAALN